MKKTVMGPVLDTACNKSWIMKQMSLYLLTSLNFAQYNWLQERTDALMGICVYLHIKC